jgi:hypothetical protein
VDNEIKNELFGSFLVSNDSLARDLWIRYYDRVQTLDNFFDTR